MFTFSFLSNFVGKSQNPFVCDSCFEECIVPSLADFEDADSRKGTLHPFCVSIHRKKKCYSAPSDQSTKEIPQQDKAVQTYVLRFLCVSD